MNDCIKTFKVVMVVMLIAVLAVLLSLSPIGLALEEEVGLSLLFQLRGAVNPPEQVVIITIDKISAEKLHLPEDPEKWPRSSYAKLIEVLNAQNPALIALNIFFGETRDPDMDQLLAEQIGKHKNVILSNRLKHFEVLSEKASSALSYERLFEPPDIFDTAALAVTPFPIPKTASTVKEYWTYKESAGDRMTFPMSVMQCYVFKTFLAEIIEPTLQFDPFLYLQFESAIERVNKGDHVLDLFQEFKTLFKEHPQHLRRLADAIEMANLSPVSRRILKAWLASNRVESTLYFNFYGQLGAIPRISFHQALSMEALRPDYFKDKVVLIGASETLEPDMNQGFYTVYSKQTAQTVTNIELAATAVANLIDQSWLTRLPVPALVSILLAWNYLLVAFFWRGINRTAMLCVMLSSVSYVAIAGFCFERFNLWLPLVVPILVQMPFILASMGVIRYFRNKIDHAHMHKAFSYYVPHGVVTQFAEHTSADSPSTFGELIQGICLATDAGQYTRLSETLPPTDLHELLNMYYAVVFAEVKRYGGIISDVTGDAALALWTQPSDECQMRIDACLAALAIKHATDIFNQSQAYQLPTRIGLHVGEMRLGNVGALDHFEYRAVGDTVNTACRIENLNKFLGTQLLVSAQVIQFLPRFFTREVGVFLLKGKSMPIHVFELVTLTGEEKAADQTLATEFVRVLAIYQSYNWQDALAAFECLQIRYPEDGPTRFYVQYLKAKLEILTAQTPSEALTWIDVDQLGNSLLF